MSAYLWLLAVPVGLALARRAGGRWETWALLLAWLALTLFLGLRREVGADWDNYLLMHARAGAYGFGELIYLGDPAYMVMSGALSRLGFAVPAVNLVCAGIFAGGLVLLVRAQPSPALAWVIALPVLVGVAAYSTRQAAAIGLLMAALACVAAQRPRLAALLVAVTPLFHWTAILLLPLVPVILTRWFPTRLMIAAGAGAGLALAALLLLTPFGIRYANIDESAGAVFRGALTIPALAVLALMGRSIDLDPREHRAVAFLAAIGLFALALTPALSTAGDRIGYYAVPIQMILLPRAALCLRTRRLRLAAQTAIVLVFGGMFLAWMTLSSYRLCLTPYRSYLADPGAIRILDPEVHRATLPCSVERAESESRIPAFLRPSG